MAAALRSSAGRRSVVITRFLSRELGNSNRAAWPLTRSHGPKKERSIIIEFGDSASNMQSGALTGYMPMDGSFTLAVTTPADLPQADYEIKIDYLAAARLSVNRGVISVYPS